MSSSTSFLSMEDIKNLNKESKSMVSRRPIKLELRRSSNIIIQKNDSTLSSFSSLNEEFNDLFPSIFLRNYVVIEEIGSGFQAKVYKVKNIDTGLIKAAKVYKENDPEKIEKIKNEIKIMKLINDEKILKYVDFYECQQRNIYIIITEYYDSITLKSYIESDVSLDSKQSFNIFNKILRAMGILHELKIVHRDLNVENILICPLTQDIVIIDFGLAICLENKNYYINIEGNKNYRPPNKENYIVEPMKCDNWGLGLILFSLCEKKIMRSKDICCILKEKKQFIKNDKFLNLICENLIGAENSENMSSNDFIQELAYMQ